MRPIFELGLGQNGFEQLESCIFERVTLHVDIDKCPDLARATEKRPELGANTGNSIRGSIRSDLRIQGRYFDRQIYNREKLYAFSERVGPVFCFASQFLQQMTVKRCVFIRLGFAHNRFAQIIYGKANFLRPSLAQCRYDVIRISPSNKLASHFGNIPTQDRSAYPRDEACRANPDSNERGKIIVAVAEILFEMLNNLTRPPQ